MIERLEDSSEILDTSADEHVFVWVGPSLIETSVTARLCICMFIVHKLSIHKRYQRFTAYIYISFLMHFMQKFDLVACVNFQLLQVVYSFYREIIKICVFFRVQCNPIHCIEDQLGDQFILARDLTVQSLLLVGHFLNNQKHPSTGDGEVLKFWGFWKTQYI